MKNVHYEIILQSLTEDLLRRDAKIKDLERRYDELKAVHAADVNSHWQEYHQKEREFADLQRRVDELTKEKEELKNGTQSPTADKKEKDTLYFYITSVGDVQAAVVKNIIDRTRFRIGNFFHTREEANGMAEKIKKLLKGE